MLKITAIGESTFCGYYDGVEHKDELASCIPLMIDAIPNVDVINLAESSTSVDWPLGRQDGDESQYEPYLPIRPSGDIFELSNSFSRVIVINLGINDAVSATPSSFYADMSELIDNCNRTGKLVYVTNPNSIGSSDNSDLSIISGLLNYIAFEKHVPIVNSGLQDVEMSDTYHPTPAGYQDLGEDLITTIAQDSEYILDQIDVTGYYIAALNKTPEIGGLDYWVDNFSPSTGQAILNCVNPNMTDTEFLNLVYDNLLGRLPDPGGETYWQSRLDIVSNGQVMDEIIGCVERQPLFQNKLAVGMAYGAVMENTAVAVDNNLSLLGVTEDSGTIYTATINF